MRRLSSASTVFRQRMFSPFWLATPAFVGGMMWWLPSRGMLPVWPYLLPLPLVSGVSFLRHRKLLADLVERVDALRGLPR